MIGDTVQAFLDRQEVGARSLDIATEMRNVLTVEKFLIEREGYTRWVVEKGTAREYISRKRFSTRGWDTPRVPTTAAQKFENPYKVFLTYHRQCTKHGVQYIRLGIPTTCIAKSIITGRETYDFAFMDSRSAVSMYPKATFVHRRTVHFNPIVYPSMQQTPFSELIPHKNIQQVYAYTAWLCSAIKVHATEMRERSIGDRYCFSLYYNEKGEVRSDSSRDKQFKDEVAARHKQNKWTLKFKKGRLYWVARQ
ncbi:hypothetical protein HWV62_45300 [Athelia sp. TMB]|nr:hypothetical protein HWV62_45300 [Athelia sp. TMB]